MIFEVKRGRVCDSLNSALDDQVIKMGAELVANGKAIHLQQKEIDSYKFIVLEMQSNYQDLEAVLVKTQELFKAKIKRLIRWIVVEGGVIIILIISMA